MDRAAAGGSLQLRHAGRGVLGGSFDVLEAKFDHDGDVKPGITQIHQRSNGRV